MTTVYDLSELRTTVALLEDELGLGGEAGIRCRHRPPKCVGRLGQQNLRAGGETGHNRGARVSGDLGRCRSLRLVLLLLLLLLLRLLLLFLLLLLRNVGRACAYVLAAQEHLRSELGFARKRVMRRCNIYPNWTPSS